MSESAARVFTKNVKNDAGDKPCRVNRISHSANHKSRIQAVWGRMSESPTQTFTRIVITYNTSNPDRTKRSHPWTQLQTVD